MEIIQVNSKKLLRKFINLPHILYKNDKNYVPSLYLSMKWMLTKKNPFFEHSQTAYFMATDNKKILGRIAAIYNKTHLDLYNDNTGFFGFFECINDKNVAKMLFEAAEKWLIEKGIEKIIGPTSLTTNDPCGFLTSGFDIEPMILMPYNFDYYAQLCSDCGYEKVLDLYSYKMDGNKLNQKFKLLSKRAFETMEKRGITIRPMTKKSFEKDVEELQNVYNRSNEINWGFIPLTKKEFKAMANDLKMIGPLDLAQIVEKDGEIIGFNVALPNMNQAFKHIKNGKLFPFGLFKLWKYKKRITTGRIAILGMLPEYKNLGIDIVLYERIRETLVTHNIFNTEACYVMETNKTMNGILEKIADGKIKDFRMFQKKLVS